MSGGPGPAPGKERRALALLLAAECLALLAAAEALAAWPGLESRLLGGLLYYQAADAAVYRPSGNTVLHYELKPGASLVSGGRRVSVNPEGFRGRPRGAAKPAGVFRIICLGSSNTYGPSVSDDGTYPAQLERVLNAKAPGRYEVWNGGANAYVVAQTVEAARLALDRYSPDLIIFQLNNSGRRPFLLGQPFGAYFAADPGLYRENLRFCWPARLDLLRRWRAFRVLALSLNRLSAAADPAGYEFSRNRELSAASMAAFGDFYAANRGRVRMAFLYGPEGGPVSRALERTGIPQLRLMENLPAGHSPDFEKVPPPAGVYGWYAEYMAAELGRLGLLKAGAKARGTL